MKEKINDLFQEHTTWDGAAKENTHAIVGEDIQKLRHAILDLHSPQPISEERIVEMADEWHKKKYPEEHKDAAQDHSIWKAVKLESQDDFKDGVKAALQLTGETMRDVFIRMDEFARKTFPKATAEHHILKLKQEVDEVLQDPTNPIEYADCLLALFGAAAKAGFTFDDLIKHSIEKLNVVKSREWEEMSDGTFQHKPLTDEKKITAKSGNETVPKMGVTEEEIEGILEQELPMQFPQHQKKAAKAIITLINKR
jgi:hypothetical protein